MTAPVIVESSDFASDHETLSHWRARVHPRRPSIRARLVRALASTLTTWR